MKLEKTLKDIIIIILVAWLLLIALIVPIKADWSEDGYLIINENYFTDNNIDYDDFWERFASSSQFKRNQLYNDLVLKQSFYEYAVDLIGRENYKDLQQLITTDLTYNQSGEAVKFIEASGRLANNFKNWLLGDKTSGSAAFFGVDKILSGTQSGSYKSDNSSPTLSNPVNVINTYNNQKYTTETNWYYDITNNNYYTTNYNYTTQIYDNTSILIYNYNNVEIKYMDQNGVYYDGVHYFELPDGRDSFNLTSDEISGLKLDYDISNYASLSDSERTLYLSHFDNNYLDLSSLNNEIEITNTSNTFVQSDSAFGTYMYLSDQQDHIVSFDNIVSNLNQWTIEWRDYYGEWTGRMLYSIVTGTSFVDGKGYFKTANGSYGSYYKDETHYKYTIDNNYLKYEYTDLGSYQYIVYVERDTDLYLNYELIPNNNSYITARYYKDDQIILTSDTFELTDNNYNFKTQDIDFDYIKLTITFINNLSISGVQNVPMQESTVPTNEWLYNTITYDNGIYNVYLNGQLIDTFNYDGIIQLYYPKGIEKSYQKTGTINYYLNSTTSTTSIYTYSGTIDTAYFGYNYYYLDEIRISKGLLYSENHNIPTAPFDTNKIYVLPTNYNINHILIKSDINPVDWQIGGIRPSDPQSSYVYISVDNDKKITSVQQFNNNNWYKIDGAIFNGSIWVDIVGTYIIYGKITESTPDLISSDPTINQIFNTTNNFYETLVQNFNEVTNIIYNLFVPSDEYMQDFRDNELEEMKSNLGILYEPFNIIDITFDKLKDTYNPYQEIEVIDQETQEVTVIQEPKEIDNRITWNNIYVPGFEDTPLFMAGTFSFTEMLESNNTLKNIHELYLTIIRVIMIVGFVGLAGNTFRKTIGK